MNRLKTSLNAKISLLVAGLSFLGFAAVVSIAISLQYSSMFQQLGDGLNRSTQLVLHAIERPMVVGDDEGTRSEIENVSRQFPDIRLFLTDFKGNVTYSSDPRAVRKDFKGYYPKPQVADFALKALEQPMAETKLTQVDDKALFVCSISIKNAPSCYHCHGSSKPILGTLVFVQDVTKQQGVIYNQVAEIIAVSIIGFIVLLALLIWCIKREVIKPIAAIVGISHKIAQGDFSVHFAKTSEDELGILSKNLETMVGTLKKQLGFSGGILNGMTVPCYVADTDERITFVNKPVLELMGLDGDPDDYVGVPVATLLYDNPEYPTLVGKVMRERKGISQAECKDIHNRKGQNIQGLVDVAPLYDLDHKLIGAFTLVTDLSEIYAHQQLVEKQNALITDVARDASDLSGNVALAAEELNAQVAQASQGADEQQKKITEIATAMEEMNLTVMEVAQNASKSATDAEEAKEKASVGMEVVSEALGAIGTIQKRVYQLKGHMDALGTRSDEIGSILGVINEIADQTNLLALNAAIEAARAGEAGRGFAVVADEVRKLAEKTMAATNEVGSVLQSIQAGTKISLGEMDQAKEEVAQTAKLGKQADASLEQIVGLVDALADQIRAIATAAQEQSAASEEISQSTERVNTITLGTAQIMQDASSAVASLSGLADDLNAIIERMQR